MKTGTFLTWLDTRVPIYSKETWIVLGYICIIVSTNNRIRCLSIFQKRGTLSETSKLPTYVRFLETNGNDENNAILDDKKQKQ
jgi:hypothetical protein